MNLTLRPGKPGDAQVCGAICYEAFKTIAEAHHFTPDFPSADVPVELVTWMLGQGDLVLWLNEKTVSFRGGGQPTLSDGRRSAIHWSTRKDRQPVIVPGRAGRGNHRADLRPISGEHLDGHVFA
jgi:hypothetical protein